MVHDVDACSDIFSSILFQLKNVIDIKGTTLLVKIKQECFPTDYVRSRKEEKHDTKKNVILGTKTRANNVDYLSILSPQANFKWPQSRRMY